MPPPSSIDTPHAAPRLFYGWVVVAATFVVLCVGFGVAYCFAAFFQPLQQEYGARRGDISLVFSLSGFLYFGIGALSGPLADRLGPRRVIAAGMAMVGIGLLLASRATALWQIYAAYGLGVGLGVGFAYVPAIAAVQRWFVRRRGLASGIAVSGIGAGTLVMPVAAGWLIGGVDIAGLALPGIGWRDAYVVLGVLSLAVGMAAALLIHGSPERLGLQAEGLAAPPVAAAGPMAGATVREALSTRAFWLLYASGAATSFGLFIPFVHLVPYATDHGIGETLALGLIAAIGVGSIVGRFAFGGFADRVGRRYALAGMFAGVAAMLLWWSLSTAAWALIVFAILFGAFYGGFVALIPALTADFFNGRSLSGIIGVLYTSVAVGTLVGPPLAGYAYDIAQDYTLPILAGAASAALGVACMLVLPDPARWRENLSRS